MQIPPGYIISSEIIQLLAKIDANRYYLSALKITSQTKEKIQRKSLLKSSVYSARVEGNPLALDTITHTSNQEKKKEIFNILKAIKFIQYKKKINPKLLLDLHNLVMEGLENEESGFRKEAGAIFNQAGMVVYQPPPAIEISSLVNSLMEYINSDKEKFPIIKAAISHLVFEKIHPFIDGNGRVGRLLFSAILLQNNLDFGFFIPFEEYIDEHREEYYFFLDSGLKKTEDYLIFILNAFYDQTEKIKKEISEDQEGTFLLSPRREEIFNIIKDHQQVSFDQVRRRFLAVPERTLRYDLKKLADSGFIIKIGNTRGVIYRVK